MKSVFDIIKTAISLDNENRTQHFDDERWIKGTQEEEAWLEKFKLELSISITHEIHFCLGSYNGENYFFAIGLALPTAIPSGWVEVGLNAGVGVAIIVEMQLPIKPDITTKYLEENILALSKAQDTDYKGHDWSDIQKLFPTIFLAKITKDFTGYEKNLDLLTCQYLLNNKKFLILPFYDETLEALNELLNVESPLLNYETILNALLSYHFKFTFLALYRSVELLYSIIYIIRVYEIEIKVGNNPRVKPLENKVTKSELLEILHKGLSWRPREREALEMLFNKTDSTTKSLMKSLAQSNPSAPDISTAHKLYNLRNTIVHLRLLEQDKTAGQLKPEAWNNIIRALIVFIKYWYESEDVKQF